MNIHLSPQIKSWEEVSVCTDFVAKTPNYVPKLLHALEYSCTIQEACLYAGVPRRTLYNHLKTNPELVELVQKAKRYPIIRAKWRMMDIIDHGNDRDAGMMIRWFLERQQPEVYGKKGRMTASYLDASVSISEIHENQLPLFS